MGQVGLDLGMSWAWFSGFSFNYRGKLGIVDSKSSCVEVIWQRKFILYYTSIKVPSFY